jgi:uncharacterized membrane protein HdeD (DUF308 family)
MTAISKPLAESWWLVLLQGIATLILGVLLVTAPGMTTVVLVTLLGIYWLVSGIFSIVGIFVGDTGVPWGWLLFSGILGILAGIVVLDHPLWSAIMLPTVLAIFIAIQGIIMGVVGLIQAFKGGGWGAGIWGVVSIIIGIVLLGRPLVAASVLPIVMGILAVVGGIVLIVLAFRVRSAYSAAMA